MEGYLRRFQERSRDEQPDRRVGSGRERSELLGFPAQGRDVGGTEGLREEQRGTEQEDVAEARGNHLLATRDHGAGAMLEEDQQAMERKTRSDPRQDQLGQVAGQDQHRDRGEGECQASHEFTVSRIPGHVVARVSHDHEADEGHEGEHRDAQQVQSEREPDAVDAQRRAGDGTAHQHGCARQQRAEQAESSGEFCRTLNPRRGKSSIVREQ